MKIKGRFVGRVFAIFVLFLLFGGFVSALETYVEAMQKLREEQQESKREIIATVVSFNAAFKDTFRLIDDEFSRLIYSMAGMVGAVFAIMFLVYAKTTSRYKRDIQILMKAHSQHIDNLISARLDEFMSRLDNRMVEEKTSTLSAVEANFDELVRSAPPSLLRKRAYVPPSDGDGVVDEKPTSLSPKVEAGFASRFEEIKANVSAVEEATVDADGRVKVLSKPTSMLNRIKKRIRNGFRRLFSRKKETNSVKEFKK